MSNDASSISAGSVSRLLGGLRDGDEEAVRQLWLRSFQPLVRLARGRLPARGCAAGDAEDVALDAFWSLCQEVARPASSERFPELHNRTHLWKLLACFTARQAFDLARKEGRRRCIVGDEAVLGENGFESFASREPPPDFSAAVEDLLECLPSDELRRVALAKMEGYTNGEAVCLLGRSLSTIEAGGRLDAERKRRADPPPPGEGNAAVENALEHICLLCLGRNPTARYSAAAELAEDLQRYLK